MEIEQENKEQEELQTEQFGSCIPSTFANKIFEKYVPANLIVGKSFKQQFKFQTEVFIHYLLTYANEMALEKGQKNITINNIKDALFEIDHENIYQELKENYQSLENIKNINKINIKRHL